MAANAVEVLAKFADFLESFEEFRKAGGFKELNKPTAKTSPKKSAPVEEPEDDDTEPEVPSADEAAKMSVVELRKLAVALGLEAQKVKADILAELDELRDGDDDSEEEFEDDEDEAADDVEDEDDSAEDDEPGEDDPYTREELEELSLKELRNIAKEEGVKSTEYRGADKDKLIELILGLDDDEGDEDADDSDDVEDSDDEDDEEEELDEAAIRKMPVSELLKLADEVGVVISRRIKTMKDQKAKKEALVDAIMASAEDDEDDDE